MLVSILDGCRKVALFSKLIEDFRIGHTRSSFHDKLNDCDFTG